MTDKALTAEVIDDVLTIQIGIGALAVAAIHSPDLQVWCDSTDQHLPTVIADPHEFAAEVVESMLEDDEGGASLLTKMFDVAISSAHHAGSLAVNRTAHES